MSLGLREYARHRRAQGLPGTTHRAVQVAIRDGRIPKKLLTRAGRIRDAAAADAAWAASTHEDRVPLTGPTSPKSRAAIAPPAISPEITTPPISPAPPSDLARARAAREATNAEIAALDLAERRGQLVNARDVETRLATLFSFCRTKLLGIPARIAQRLRHLTSEDLAVIDGEIRSALEELAEGRTR